MSYEISMVLIMSNDQEFDALIEALRIIHKKTGRKVIPALKKLKDYEDNNNIEGPELDTIIETINTWLDPSQNKEKGDDNYKVARCLVWYIAKSKLGNKDILPAKFPYCKCSKYHQLKK